MNETIQKAREAQEPFATRAAMSMKELVVWLRKASTVIYLATDASVADDISPKLVRAADTIERLERERDEARGLIRWAHDTLYEINPSNYDHNEVCRLNDASVEVILGLAPSLGEMHGKTREWWMARARNEADLAIGAVGGAAEAEAATLRARVERLEKALVQIAGLNASAPSSDAHTRLHKALDMLDTARDCARAALTEEQP